MSRVARAVSSLIPEGSPLPDAAWRRRHRGILVVLGLQALGIFCFSLGTAHSLGHSLLGGGIIAATAVAAALPLRPRTLQAALAAFGLVASSAILVHLSGGYIEFHFHFFVMVGLLALYQEWAPFLFAIGFVLLHHGVVGVLAPAAVYNHPAAIAHPWQWAAIHAAFIAAMSVVSLIAWRVNETTHAFSQLLLTSAGEGVVGLDLERRVTFVNEAAVRLFDCGDRRVIGEPIHALLSSPHGGQASLGARNGEPGTLREVVPEIVRRSNGTAVSVECVSTPILERGQIVGTALLLKDVTDRERLFQESERRRLAAEALAQVGRLISQSLDPQEVSQRIVDSIRTLLSASTAVVYRVDPETEALAALAVSGDAEALPSGTIVLPPGVGAVGLAVRERHAVVTADILADSRIQLTPDFQSRIDKAGYRAAVAVPLMAQGRVIGALGVGDRAERTFDEDDVRLAQAFTDQASIAIENARLHEETEERLIQSETLLSVSQQVSGVVDVTEMMRRVARETGRALGADMVGAFLADADHTVLRPIAGYHVPKHLLVKFMTLPIPVKGHRVLEEAWAQRRAVASSDVAQEPRVDHELLEQFPHRSSLFCPMSVRGEPIGGLFAIWFEEERRFTPAELRLVEGLGRQAAIALSNARLVEELTTREARLEALLIVNRELSCIQPVESLLARIAEACGRLFEAHSAAFRVVEGDELVLSATWGTTDESLASGRLRVTESLAGTVATTGEPLIVTDPAADPRVSPARRESLRQLGVRSFLGVPVKLADSVIGVLTVRSVREDGFSAADLEMAKAFASQAVVALENSRLYQETQGALQELSRAKDQLVQSQKMEAIGQLAGGIAHDFNNLLTVITGRSRLVLARVRAGDPIRRDVELIDQAAERAAALTRQLLAFSRKQVLRPKPLDLNALVGDLAPILRRLIGEHIQLVITPGGELGHVMADPGQLEQVVINLVVNARDAMPHGGTVTIGTQNRPAQHADAHLHGQVPPGHYVALMVQDSGWGMDQGTLDKIFEPFFTTKPPGKGTGLGLSTVYGIVRQSGGDIGVDSTVGRGTTFTIYLPRIDEPADPHEGQAIPAPLARGEATILLVEDDTEVRELASELLKSCGYTVLETGDPLEALVIGERHRGEISLLISDIVMPAMWGPALAAQLRRHHDLCVLYMSGYTDEMLAAQGTVEPVAPLLRKPFSLEALARAVRDTLVAKSATPPMALANQVRQS